MKPLLAAGLITAGGLVVGTFLGVGWPTELTRTATANAVPLTSPLGRTERTLPRYGVDGALLHPGEWTGWTFVGASIGLSYNPDLMMRHGDAPGTGMFHNVYITPWAYEEYRRTGEFPEQTMFALTIYMPDEKVEPSKHGFFEGALGAVEISVKDSERFEGGWAYFNFGADLERAMALPSEACFSCHLEHGAQDNVFLQFHPVLRDLESHRVSTRASESETER